MPAKKEYTAEFKEQAVDVRARGDRGGRVTQARA